MGKHRIVPEAVAAEESHTVKFAVGKSERCRNLYLLGDQTAVHLIIAVPDAQYACGRRAGYVKTK